MCCVFIEVIIKEKLEDCYGVKKVICYLEVKKCVCRLCLNGWYYVFVVWGFEVK